MLEFMGCLWLDDGCPWDRWDRNLHGMMVGLDGWFGWLVWMVVGWFLLLRKWVAC